MIEADAAGLYWWDPRTQLLKSCIGSRGSETFEVGMDPEGTISQKAFKQGQPIAVTDYTSWPSDVVGPTGRRMECAVAVPMLTGGDPIGTLSAYRLEPRPFTEREVERLAMLARLVAPTVDPKQLELEGAAMQELMAMALARAPMVFTLVNPSQMVTLARGNGLEALGVPAGDLVGARFGDACCAPPTMTVVLASALKGSSTQIEWTSTLNGRRWITYLAPIRDQAGVVKEVCTVSIDLTEQWEADNAQRDSEMQSRFLAVMSHEMRTPLNSILGFAQLLLRRRGEDRRGRYVEHIISSGQHLVNLVNDLLDLARIQAGEIAVTLSPVDLAKLVRQAADMSAPLADANSLELKVQAPAEVEVMADSRRLYQVVVNLLSNAIKFTNPGGTVGLTTRQVDGWIEIDITDTGVGLDPIDIDRIFEEFIQASAATATPQQGTGLGLPLSRRLVEMMGGHLNASSTPGEGSTFTIRLPATTSLAARKGHRP